MEQPLDIELQNLDTASSAVFAASVHCHSACNLVVWNAVAVSENNWDEVKKYIARLMDRLADLMHDYQKFAPLVALIDMQEASPGWEQVMGDQDWHRGRFVLQGVRSYDHQSLKEAKLRWLGPLLTSQYTPRRITIEDFSVALDKASDLAKPPKGTDAQLFSRYASNLKASVHDSNPEKMPSQWQEELLADISSLLGRSILEVTTIGK